MSTTTSAIAVCDRCKCKEDNRNYLDDSDALPTGWRVLWLPTKLGGEDGFDLCKLCLLAIAEFIEAGEAP